ncbi:MAG: sigma-70 family RNA polymerase sigma factor [Bacteroidia bacterium]|nr:sigma-70 family RNA polymerase sigma factor [Bacteroidia bacterium]
MTENREIESLFRQYYRPLCLYAFRFIKDTVAVEDVVQEAFVKCLEKRNSPDWPKSPKQYLFRIVHNSCVDFVKANSPLIRTDVAGISEYFPDENIVDKSVLMSQLWSAIDKMPEKRRQVFLMSKRDSLSYARIGELLGISENTVHNHLTKAMKSLKGVLAIMLLFIFNQIC